jgi:hypothetical protein
MSEKLLYTLPPTRCEEPMYLATMQHAASMDRPVSWVMREALVMYLQAHGRMVPAGGSEVHQIGALPCNAEIRD